MKFIGFLLVVVALSTSSVVHAVDVVGNDVLLLQAWIDQDQSKSQYYPVENVGLRGIQFD